MPNSIFDQVQYDGYYLATLTSTSSNATALDLSNALDCMLGFSYLLFGAGSEGTVVLQESDNGSTGWATISGSTRNFDENDDIGTLRGWRIDPGRHKRYIRIRTTETGGGSVTIIGYKLVVPKAAPASQTANLQDLDAL